MPRYTAYGLTIDSALACPELAARVPPPKHTAPDVIVRLGDVPEHLSSSAVRTLLHEIDGDTALLRVPGVARYLVRDGREIVVQPDAGVADADLSAFVPTLCFGTLLRQRGYVTLHASAVSTHRGAAIFLGEDGSGKSALAGALVAAGLSLMAEDLVAITFGANGHPWVLPGYPALRISNDVATSLGHDSSTLKRVRPALERFVLPVTDGFETASQPLWRAYHLHPSNLDIFGITAMPSTRFLSSLLVMAYGRGIVTGTPHEARHWRQAVRIAHAVPAFSATRPSEPLRLEEMRTCITDHLRNGEADGR